MKIPLIVATFIFTILASGYCQSPQADSLEMSLQIAPQDTSKVSTLLALSGKYVASEPLKAKQFAEEGLALARDLKFLPGEIKALICLSEYHFRQGNYANTIDYGTQSLKIASQLGDSVAMADAYRILGNTNSFGLKQYDQALLYHLKALRIYEQQLDKVRLAAQYGSITWLYAITNQNLEEAHRYVDKGISISKELKNYQIMSYNYNSKGLIYFIQHQYDSALINLKLSIQIAELASDRAVIAYDKTIIGNVYLQQRNYAAAVDFYNQAMTESKKLNLREALKDAYSGLAKSYEGQNQFNKAYQFHLLYTQLKDSLLNWEVTQKTLMIQKGYEEERREAIITQLEKENQLVEKEKRLYVVFFVAGLSTLLVIIFLIIRSNHQRSKANLLLQELNYEVKTQNQELLQSREEIAAQRDIVADQNAKLQQVNDTKDRLFAIIGHDLRGPVASLSGLLGLVAKDVITTDELKMLTPKISQNVASLQEMLENLLRWSFTQMKGFKSMPAKVGLHAMAEKKIKLFAEAAEAKKILLTNKVPKELTVYVDENHLKLILRNLISNAVKFTQEGGHVNIEASISQDFIEIRIADTGIGISPERMATLFDGNSFTSQGTSGEKGSGLGLLLCKEMAEANGGHINASSVEGAGSVFRVYFKVHV